MNKHIAFLIVLCLRGAALQAQQDDLFLRYKEKFPDEPAVFVARTETMNIEVDGDSLSIYSDRFEDMVHLKDMSDGYGSKRVYGSHFNQVENLRARTLLWEKNRYKELAVSDFKKNSDQDEGIFYDDSYYYSFNFPSVALRNRTQLEYREVLRNPKFLSGYLFQTYVPQGKSSFVIKTTKDVDLHYEVVNDPSSLVKFRRTEKGNNVTLEWTATDLHAWRTEDRSPSLRYMVPHVICYVKSYKTKKGTVNVLRGLDDLFDWYYTFVKDLDQEASAELKGIVGKLKAGSKGELDFVKKVYYWVQSNIEYIAFEEGMRGFIPHSGSYVCEKRYGDCKDMASLIITMLREGGVKAYPTWIGTRDLPYRYSKVPTPLVDNHMIAAYIAPDKTCYFLDGTSDHTPFGFPSSMIQGKEALIGYGPGKYEVREVPVIARERNVMTDSMKLTIRDDMIQGTGSSTLSGFAKVFSGYELDRADEDQVKRYVTKLLGKGNNKFYLDSYKVLALQDNDKPTRITYGFRISDYHQKIGDELFVNLNLNKDYYNAYINTELRKAPYENDYRYTKYEDIVFEIPAGYTVEYLPENFASSGEAFGCSVSYLRKGNSIIFHKEFYLNYLLLAPEEFKTWNEAVKKFSEAYKESIILKKK